VSRARNIKPGFFKNDLLAECQPLARILFAGLWCEADRAGRLEDRPKRLKADILPYDECDIDALLAELSNRGFIVRYVVDGKGFIAVPEFGKHQNPHCKEPASTIPAPDKHGASTVQQRGKNRSRRADSPSLIPDSPSQKEQLPEPAAPVRAAVLIPLNDGTEYPLSDEQAAEYARLYPAVDVPAELRAIRAWGLSNLPRRKTRSGVLKHVNGWLAKAQNEGPKARAGPAQHGKNATAILKIQERQRERLAAEGNRDGDHQAALPGPGRTAGG
jgi:hypothetical protein